jgi:hypothetical protein
MIKKKKIATAHNRNHYKLQKIFNDNWYVERVMWFKSQLKKFGCPIPRGGFRNEEEKEVWRNKYYEARKERKSDPEYKRNTALIKAIKTNDETENCEQIKKFKNNFMPILIGEFIDDVLEHYNIDSSNKLRDYIDRNIFFNHRDFAPEEPTIHLMKDPKTGEHQIWMRIFGHTTLKDIKRNWKFIRKCQKQLPDYCGKNKVAPNFDRNIIVYHRAQELKLAGAKNIYKTIFNEMGAKLGFKSSKSIGVAVSRMDKRFNK